MLSPTTAEGLGQGPEKEDFGSQSVGHECCGLAPGFQGRLTVAGQGATIGLDGDKGRVCLYRKLKWEIPAYMTQIMVGHVTQRYPTIKERHRPSYLANLTP